MPPYLKAAQYEPKSPQEHIDGISCILPLEGRGGFVFMMAYLNKKNPDAEALLQILRDQTHRLTNSFGKDANAQHRFEQFLGALNETLAHLIREGRFYIPIQQFHALVGIICEGDMYLSGAGELTAIFLHRKPSQRYQIFNIFRSIQTEQALPTWEKPFAVVLDGTMENGDVFCVSHKDLPRVIAPDDLHSLLTTLPPKSSVEKIRQYFSPNDGLLLFVIKAENPQTSVTPAHAKPLSDVSIDSFVRAQDETARLLADERPNVLAFLRGFMISLYKKQTERSRILSDLKRSDSKTKILVGVAKSLGKFLWRHIRRTIRRSVSIAVLFSKKETRAATIKHVLHAHTHFNESLKRFVGHLRSLPPRTQRSLSLVSVLCLALVIGLGTLSISHAKSKEQRAFDSYVSRIEDTVERGNGAMIYKDENQSRLLFQEAQGLLASLTTNKPERAETIKKLSAEIQSSLNELRHVVTIPNPALLGDLANNTTTGVRIATAQGHVYTLGADQNVYELDVLQKGFRVLNGAPITTGTVVSASLEDQNFYLLDSNRQMFAFKTDAKIPSSVPIDLSLGVTKDLVAYAHRLYLLQSNPDTTDSQVIRFNKSGDGFSSGQSWIVSKTHSLQQATSMALDGTLYVLNSNGEVFRFQNGSEMGWELGVVDPPLSAPTSIRTDADSHFVYVLEPSTKRLVVYQKETGAFVVQYTSDTFEDLRDVQVDEKNYTVYLLSGSRLYSIAASHLKK